uniref:Uncharacterized protein n=1 Tax=Heterosigma akashiwo TaxID=2829 RepID=A0A6V1VM37_HETAK
MYTFHAEEDAPLLREQDERVGSGTVDGIFRLVDEELDHDDDDVIPSYNSTEKTSRLGLKIAIVNTILVILLLGCVLTTSQKSPDGMILAAADRCSIEEVSQKKNERLECCTSNDYPVLGGVDLVQFRKTGGEEVRYGVQEYDSVLSTVGGNYRFWFTTEENRNMFNSNPWFYAPAFGGFDPTAICGPTEGDDAVVMSLDALTLETSNLNQYKVYDGNLIYFSNSDNKDTFELAPLDYLKCEIQMAQKMFGSQHAGVFNTRCHEFEYQISKDKLHHH